MSPDFLIVGAGMAGAATAAHLSALGSTLVLEQGAAPAQEGAAQNAGLIRRLDPEPCDRALAQRTFLFLTTIAPEWGLNSLSTQTGAVLGLVRDPLRLHNARAHLNEHGITIQSIDPASIPVLTGSPVQHAWHLPDERICNGPAMAKAMLAKSIELGATLRCDERIIALTTDRNRVTGVQTTRGHYAAGCVILAGGAWTRRVAQTAGIDRPLFALERTAGLITGQLKPAPGDPWVWLDDVGIYAKPEGDHWLVSPCNERVSDVPAGPGSTGEPSPSDWSLTERKIQTFFPSIAPVSRIRSWTGLRTFAPDRRPLIGEDNDLANLWWASGLGGSGVSSCWGVGEAIAAWISQRPTPWLDPATVDPCRTQLRRWPIFPSGDPAKARLIEGVPNTLA